MYRLIQFVFVAAISLQQVSAQDIPTEYIQEGLNNNLVLKDKKISLEKSLVALKEARSLFLPTTWFEGQYTVAEGGRAIDFPVGDLLNPVYQTLNQLTGSDKFPTIGNVSEQFLPNNFYDVRIKTTMPIVNSELKYNRSIKEQQTLLQQNEIEIYRRALTKEIKTAYYNYLAAGKAIEILRNSLQIVQQNLKANEAMLRNGKGLPAYVSRAESEVKQVESQLETAANEEKNARAYFNFLLNRSLTDSIKTVVVELDGAAIAAIISNPATVEQREELKALSISKGINESVLKMNRSFRIPKLNAFLDLASQGFNFEVNSKSLFYLGGVQLQVPIFSGKRNLYKIQTAELNNRSIELNTDQTKQQLQLSASVSRNTVASTYTTYNASLKQMEASMNYFKLIDRGYREGVNSFIEYLDARNQLTNSQLKAVINKFRLFSAMADYERQTASYSFN